MIAKQYRAIDVWARKDEGTLVRYRCVEVLPVGGYCVQSADFYNLPYDKVESDRLDKQFVELLAEEAPDSRSGVFSSLSEAIRAFVVEFGSSDD
jgi:hypothetical protein